MKEGSLISFGKGGGPLSAHGIIGMVEEDKGWAIVLVPGHHRVDKALPECLVVPPEGNPFGVSLVLVPELQACFPPGVAQKTGGTLVPEMVTEYRQRSRKSGECHEEKCLLRRGVFASPGSPPRAWNARLVRLWQAFQRRSWAVEIRARSGELPNEIAAVVETLIDEVLTGVEGESPEKDAVGRPVTPANEALPLVASPVATYQTGRKDDHLKSGRQRPLVLGEGRASYGGTTEPPAFQECRETLSEFLGKQWPERVPAFAAGSGINILLVSLAEWLHGQRQPAA